MASVQANGVGATPAPFNAGFWR